MRVDVVITDDSGRTIHVRKAGEGLELLEQAVNEAEKLHDETPPRVSVFTAPEMAEYAPTNPLSELLYPLGKHDALLDLQVGVDSGEALMLLNPYDEDDNFSLGEYEDVRTIRQIIAVGHEMVMKELKKL